MLLELLRVDCMELLQSQKVTSAVYICIGVNLGNISKPTEVVRFELVVRLVIVHLFAGPDTLDEVVTAVVG